MAKRIKDEIVHDDGTYVVKKNRKESIVALIICILIAFAIWIYAKNAEIKENSEEPPISDSQTTEQAGGAEAEA